MSITAGVDESLETSPRQVQILVDADACPVKEEIKKVAERHGLITVFVANSGLRPSRDPQIRHVIVPSGPDAADDWIAENTLQNDIAITADIPLAQRVVARGGLVLKHNGKVFSADNIGMAVAMRDLKHELRETGAITTHNPEFSARDRSQFLSALDMTVRRCLKANTGVKS